jgi:hypothetical protein
MGALVRGNVHTALRLHPLVFLVALDVAVLWVQAVRRRGGGHRPPERWTPEREAADRRRNTLTMAMVTAQALLFVAVWAIRLADGSIRVVE